MNIKQIDPKELKRIKTAYDWSTDVKAIEAFEADAKRWVKAIKDRRMGCVIKSVSRSGMSRTMYFFEGRKGGFSQFYTFLNAMGYTQSRDRDGISVSGCGMDMVFHVNYTICHRLCRYGIITKKSCDHLAQQTPTKF